MGAGSEWNGVSYREQIRGRIVEPGIMMGAVVFSLGLSSSSWA